MKQLMRALMIRLAGKGMEVSAIPAYIRNVANSAVAHPMLGLDELNDQLRLLGWENAELDDSTLQLILAIFESDSVHEPSQYPDRTSKSQSHPEPPDEKQMVSVFKTEHCKAQVDSIMDAKANPIRKRGERNVYCPFYNDCLDYAIKHFWQFWNCSHCPNKEIQAIAQLEYGASDTNLYYDLSPAIFRGIGKHDSD
jgi:hypothetical protein